ncbi:MAG TPA: hypothetical protein VGG27_07365 [Magnetospirillaceae bacterium]|jgi:hypothetical protein
MARLDSKLEAKGAEYLVLGNLLIWGLDAHLAYANTPGHDVIAINPKHDRLCRIQVKSRWAKKPRRFVIRNLDSDFVVFVALNRGPRGPRQPNVIRVRDAESDEPNFYVIPTSVVGKVRQEKGWGTVYLKNIKDLQRYRDAWDLIQTYLEMKP